MIKEYLVQQKSLNKMHNSYLLNIDNLDEALKEIESFAKIFLSTDDLNHCDDYILIKKLDSKSKNIAIDQIRDMQKFLYKTSVISGKKIAVIYAADQMNLNAANSCLKLLEETPKNTYIFLITNNASSLLPTILSRCMKINYLYQKNTNNVIDQSFIQALLNDTQPKDRQKFLAQFAAKDRDLWKEFSTSMASLIAKLCKNQLLGGNLSEYERKLLQQLDSNSPKYLQEKHSKINNIINEVNKYDLDLRASCLMLINQFSN